MIGRALQQQFQLSHPNINEKTLLLEPLAELHPDVPKIIVTHDNDPHWKKPDELELSKNKYKNTKVIFLARDPRDVVVSAYFEQKKRVSFWLEGLKKNHIFRNIRKELNLMMEICLHLFTKKLVA